MTLVLRKNGGAYATLAIKYAANASDDFAGTFNYIDITTNAADYYELWGTTANNIPMLGTAKDNWWHGQIVY